MTVWPGRSSYFHLAMAFAIALLFSWITIAKGWPWMVLAVGPCAGLLYYYSLMRRYIRRRRLAKSPFPEQYRKILEECVPFYDRLDGEARIRFENDVRFFLAEQRIYGVQGADVPERVKVLVGASAAMLGHGMPDWEWPDVRDIVIYPTAFDREYEIGGQHRITGMVHSQGPVVFSEQHLKHGFRLPHDGANVGLHELAHVLDMASGEADGVPAGMEWVATAPWVNLMVKRLREKHGQKCREVLGSYACTNEAEFFAVAVEVFFEQPERLLEKDPKLYEMLERYFNLDPRTGKIKKPEAK